MTGGKQFGDELTTTCSPTPISFNEWSSFSFVRKSSSTEFGSASSWNSVIFAMWKWDEKREPSHYVNTPDLFSERCEKRRPRHTRLITPCRTLRFVPVVELFLGWKAEKMHFHNRKRESPNLLLFQRQRPVLVSFAPCWFYQSINLDFSNLIPLMYMLHTSLERDLKDSGWIMMRSCQIMTS